MAVAEGAFDPSSHSHLAKAVIRLSIALLLAAVDGSSDSDQQAMLHLMLPASYPAAAAARVEALTCASLGREAEGRCAAALQAFADEAAGAPSGGQECLYPLAEAAMQQLQAALEAGQQRAQDTAGRGTGQPTAQPGAGEGTMAPAAGGGGSSRAGCIQLALLRLDHMHARAAYSRTLRRWAGELGLGGRLLFSSGGGRGLAGAAGAAPIILILLEGSAGDVKEFVVRLRTRNVDVDSKGRCAPPAQQPARQCRRGARAAPSPLRPPACLLPVSGSRPHGFLTPAGLHHTRAPLQALP